MSVIGKVANGIVVLPPGAAFPDGAEVKVEVSPPSAGDPFVAALQGIIKPRSAGSAGRDDFGLPDDLAVNHDYYIHGHPHKQQPRANR
jgi:hypothetical protein